MIFSFLHKGDLLRQKGGSIIPSLPPLTTSPTTSYENTDIVQLTDKWIIAQKDNYSLAVKSGVLESSTDNSQTFPNSISYDDTNRINNAHIFSNGNILLATTQNKLILTNLTFDFFEEKTVLDTDGSPFIPHIPVTDQSPGRYYYTNWSMSDTPETDLYLWGNYCNVNYGAAPVQIMYTKDQGQTIQIAYKFGVHLNYKDDGTTNGGPTGTVLGDPANPIIARHNHCVEYSPSNDKWYCFTGDLGGEIHWMEGTYNSVNDSWNWVEINFGTIPQTSHLKVTEAFFYGGNMYYSSDATNIPASSTVNGIYKVPVSAISDVSQHQKIISYPAGDDWGSNLKLDRATESILFIIGNVTRLGNKTSELGIAKNLGAGEVQFRNFDGNNFIRVHSPNDNGYFRIDTGKFAVLQNKSFLIKVGDDLFNNIP